MWKFHAAPRAKYEVTERQEIVVVGAGVHGLCAAFELRRRGREVLVLDRFAEAHDRGGSHGAYM